MKFYQTRCVHIVRLMVLTIAKINFLIKNYCNIVCHKHIFQSKKLNGNLIVCFEKASTDYLLRYRHPPLEVHPLNILHINNFSFYKSYNF